MLELDTSRFRTKPFRHQVAGVKALVTRPAFALFDDPRTGKSKQVVDAACVLAEAGKIDTVVVIAPAGVRGVWVDPDIGEIRQHAWVRSLVMEFHSKMKQIWSDKIFGADTEVYLKWIVTNYEFLRRPERLAEFVKYVGKRTLLVLDESDLVKSRTAQQTKAIRKRVRPLCDRCVLLTGTPGNPLELWSQLMILDERILGRYTNFYHFRAHFATMGGWHNKQVMPNGWVNMDEFHRMTRPYVLRRRKEDCLDLPPRLYTTQEVPLTAESWKRYQQLRKEAFVALDGKEQLEPNAAVRIMRLAQLTSGFLGQAIDGDNPELMEYQGYDISSEKLDWAVKYLTEECTAQAVIVWCRWRRERERLVEALRKLGLAVFEIYGNQPRAERDVAKAVFHNRSAKISKRTVLVAQPEAGGVGLDMAQASEVVRLSSGYSYRTLVQSDDRPYGPGQINTVIYLDILATGPEGQKTVDSAIVKALRRKDDVAKWTAVAWRRELDEE
jgi:SNF2 family DNA or RNA helicase